jgi:hypothetical protein
MPVENVSSGLPALDAALGGLRLGDNVVWQVDELENYLQVARPFAARAQTEGRRLLYLRFTSHPFLLAEQEGVKVIVIDPSPGFDAFSVQVHQIIEDHGPRTYYLFDNLSALVGDWATDELVANFFQVTCPFLRELETVAYSPFHAAGIRRRWWPASATRLRS